MTLLCLALFMIIFPSNINALDVHNCTTYSCKDQTVNCNSNEDCIVRCSFDSCVNSTVICPQSPNKCEVNCFAINNNAQRSCKYITIDARGGTNELIVNATGGNDIMQYAQIYCPSDHGQCSIYCGFGGFGSCRDSNITASHASHTNISLYASGAQAFERGTIIGSPYGIIDVSCIDTAPCQDSVIYADPNSLSLNVNATLVGGLERVKIYCPHNNAVGANGCNIEAAIKSGHIYAANTFKDINFVCSGACDDLIMYCSSNYTVNCPMVFNGSTNHWQCVGTDIDCPQPADTFAPTIDPTYVPTSSVTTNSSTIYGIQIMVSFHYELLVNYSNISRALLLDIFLIFVNMTEQLLNVEIQEIEENCINAKDYDIDVDIIEKIVIINATVYVCNKQTENTLNVHVDENLKEDLLNIGTNNQILTVPNQNILIQVTAISNDNQFTLTSTTSVFEPITTTIMQSNLDPVVYTLIVIIIILVLIIMIALWFMWKRRSNNVTNTKHILSNIKGDGIDNIIANNNDNEPGAENKEQGAFDEDMDGQKDRIEMVRSGEEIEQKGTDWDNMENIQEGPDTQDDINQNGVEQMYDTYEPTIGDKLTVETDQGDV